MHARSGISKRGRGPKELTSVHWHGIELQSYYDGVPGWTGYDKQVTRGAPSFA